MEKLPDRVRNKIVVTDTGCWEWQGARDRGGYGRVSVERKTMFVHRFVYRELVGDPGPLSLDHLCRNHPCCNPEHLEPVEHLVNVRRGICAEVQRARHRENRYCPQGHPLFGENLGIYMHKDGYENKHCRTCGRERARAYYARKKAAG